MDAAQELTRAAQCDRGAGRMLPALILDEVHVLNETHMSAVRADLLRFIWPQLQAKQTAQMTVMLLSSDARAHDIVQTCACLPAFEAVELASDMCTQGHLPTNWQGG